MSGARRTTREPRQTSGAIGQPLSRVDGRAKVTGSASYAAEFDLPGLVHAALVMSTVPRGRITAIDTAAAERADGVHAVITHLNAPKLPYRPLEKRPSVDPESGEQLRVFQGPEVLFSGQPVGVVVADTVEQARHAAALVRVSYETSEAATVFAPSHGRPPSEATAKARQPGDAHRGDADRAFAECPVTVDATYVQPREHHNPIELHVTVASWEGGQLTLYDKTQWVDNDRSEIAHVFGIPEDHIRVISPFVGGAFGSALRTWPHVTVAALAAREVGRPVRLELTRREMYTSTGFRPRTEQRVALGARRDGTLAALIQEVTAQTSTYEEYAEEVLDPPRTAYACANVRTRYRFVDLNTNTPCPMRGPGSVTGVLALEIAMDELAVTLRMDPVELRLRNYAERDEHKDLPWSSKELRACYHLAAERFGWDHRTPEPRSMRDGGSLVGYGMATAIYPARRRAASASATLFADGTALVRSAASDMGPGTYTSMTQVAADALGLPLDRVRFELGDTEYPEAPVHGGSITMASVGSAVRAACEAVRDKARALEGASLRDHGLDRLEASAHVEPGDESEHFSTYSFGAIFAEVRVDPDLGTVRVPRMVGAYDVGRVINPKTAHSQCIGGMVGGIGMALFEEAAWDPRFGRVMNANLAEYLVPVNADVPALEALFVASDDRRLSELGSKGLAELAICGVAPAIVNAVYHATGKRVRELPVTPDKLVSLRPPMTQSITPANPAASDMGVPGRNLDQRLDEALKQTFPASDPVAVRIE
ncbi:MAG TPA: xanthine dehydrogenase family protein molybdopterin-binding subunit [Gemmatimonadales bacterium]|nr:xanthine dehydrogenase family protein molybdopterin-binding subunit [Gemmatimonadales bacterium]